ncbi:MAG TPA: cysteine hydrolase family protein [Thermoanaerobaculia bacterium]|nr:cysteine hydrolase family protein [Thermoanaerobaculia bacterium]
MIDFQNDYFPGGAMELVGIDEAAGKAATLLSRARELGLPIFHAQHVALQPEATFFRPYTKGAEIDARVVPMPGEPVAVKHFPNAFRDTFLAGALRSAGIDQLILCGAMTHMCIDASTRAAFDLGFQCTVVEDACATRDLAFEGRTIPARDVHGAFVAALGSAYARILRADALSFR